MDYGAYINSSRWRDNPARLVDLEAAGFRRRIRNVSEDEAQSICRDDWANDVEQCRFGAPLSGDRGV